MSLFVDIKKDLGSFKLDVKFDSDGSSLGFLGASGSGKSMTLKCIAGIETPDEGKIILNGVTLFDSKKKINVKPQDRKVGYLFQNYALFPNMTVEQNIKCGLCRENNDVDKEKKVNEIIDKMYLTGLNKRKPHELSGGQQQRCALARILLNKPEILLLDEPFSALDSFLRNQLEDEMKAIFKEYDKDVILVSHNRDEVFRICKYAAVIDKGQMLTFGEKHEVFDNPASKVAAKLTGCKNIADCVKKDDHHVFIPDWNITYEVADTVGDNIVAVALRAHYLNPDEIKNSYDIHVISKTEEPFEWSLRFRYKAADKNSRYVWWRMPKNKNGLIIPEKLGINPADIMLLYKE